MATSAPLLGKQGKAAHSKASIFYGADEYLEEPSKYPLPIGASIASSTASILSILRSCHGFVTVLFVNLPPPPPNFPKKKS